MPVSMFTMKIESSKLCERIATSPSAARIENDRHQQRHDSGDDRAEDEQQDDQRGREAELELALLEVALREQVEVVVEHLVARHRDREVGITVGLLDDLDHDAGRLLADDVQQQERRVAVLGDQAAVLRRGVVADVEDRLGRTQVVDEPVDEGGEAGVAHRELVRAHDREVGDAAHRAWAETVPRSGSRP